MIDDAADAVEILADDVEVDIARDDEAVAAETADDGRYDVRTRAQDEEGVVALKSVDFQRLFDAVNLDVETRAKDAVLGDEERIFAFCADCDDRIEAEAGVDADRRVDVVLERIVVVTDVVVDVVFRDER